VLFSCGKDLFFELQSMERLSSSARVCSIDYSIAVILLSTKTKHVEVTSRNCDCQRFTGIPVIS